MDAQQAQQIGEQLADAFTLGIIFAVIAGLYAGGLVRLVQTMHAEWRSMRRWRRLRRRQLLQVRA